MKHYKGGTAAGGGRYVELNPKSWTLLEVRNMSKVLSYEEKLELIRLWKEENYSIKMLSDHFGVAKSVVERWRKRYLIHGEKGLILQTTNPPYSEEQKGKILSEINNGISKRTILAKYKISHSTLSKWMLKSSNMEKFNPAKAIEPEEIKSLKKQYKDNPAVIELLERLEYSEMENACLKKLATLVQARKEKEQKQSKN